MLGRVYSKKKKRPLLPEGEGAGEYHNGSSMPRPAAPTTQQYHEQGGSPGRHHAARSHPTRMTRAVTHGAEKEHKKSGSGFVKKVFGGGRKDREAYANVHPGAHGGDGVMYTEDDECELDEADFIDEESEEGPQVMHHRRRFVRSGLTTYEQWISKNSVGRRFNRRSYQLPSSNLAKPTSGSSSPRKTAPAMDKENEPLSGNQASPKSGLSSLSSALQEVINSQPTALKSVIDPSAGPARVQRSFVVEQTPDGNLFVASKRVPVGPTRTMDDSFIGLSSARGTDIASRAGNLSRRTDLDIAYRQKWEKNSVTSSASGSSGSASAASLLSMSKAGVRRRLSGADRQSTGPLTADSISTAPTAMAGVVTRTRRSSSSSRMLELTRQSVLGQMAFMYMDHARQRSSSKASDVPALVQPRKESTAMLLQAGSFEDVDALPMTIDDLNERKHSIDKGPMTMDEFMFDLQAPPPPPRPQLLRKGSSGKSGRSKRVSKASKDEEKEEEEVDNMLSRSFLNLKDVDALKRSRSLEDEEKVAVTTEDVEAEEEYPDINDERVTDDYGSSYEDESAVRTSNITEFLGGYKGRTSMNRNSLAGRNSLGRNPTGKNDFVSRAARSLRNSRKVAQESAKVSSELSRKLREARARVPLDLRGDPPQSTRKKRGFMGRDGGKRVRFDMTRYCREFEVLTPLPSDDEVQQWSQRDSEQDDDDDDDDYDDEDGENRSEADSVDFGVPVPGAVLAAAMTDANAYYSAMPASALNYVAPMRYSVGRSSVQEDKRVSVVSRRSNAKQNEVFM